MPHNDQNRVVLRPLGGRGSRRGGWIAVGGVAAALVGVALVGRFGGQSVSPAPSPASSAEAVGSSAESSPAAAASAVASNSIASSPGAADPDIFNDPWLGFAVRRSATPGEWVAPQAAPRTVEFVHSRISLSSPGYGTIKVAVGTTAQGALVPTPAGRDEVYGSDADSLEGHS